MNDWWKFDGPDDDALPSELAQHEAAAMTAIRAIADYGDAHPELGLVIGATLRKLETIAASRATSLGLRSVRVKRG